MWSNGNKSKQSTVLSMRYGRCAISATICYGSILRENNIHSRVRFRPTVWWKRGRVARRELPRVEHSVRHNLKSNIRRRARRPEMNRKRRCIKPQVPALQFINACGRTPAFDAIAELLPRYPARLICNWRCASHFQLQLGNIFSQWVRLV